MESTQKLATRFILLLLLCVLGLSGFASPASAISYQTVNCVVAYDEAFEDRSWESYCYHPETLARVIVEDVSYRFSQEFRIYLRIVEFVMWEPYLPHVRPEDWIYCCIQQTGFRSCILTNVLIAFTGEDLPGAMGCADREKKAVIVEEFWTQTFGQHTDNILQHELGHLYDCDHHNEKDLDCNMNVYYKWIWAEWASFPIELLTENWCEVCEGIIMANRTTIGQTMTGSSGSRYRTIPIGAAI